MQASLAMFKPDGQRRDFPLAKPKIIVGRRNTCDLRIPLSSVSREHCEFELRDDEGLYLRDLGSSNGTFRNGERVQEIQLAPGDRVQIGPVHFHVVIDGEPEEIEPVHTVLPGEAEEPSAAATQEHQFEPETLETSGEVPEEVEDESHSPTAEWDAESDDAIAALQRLADHDEDDEDEEEDEQSLPLLDEDDEDEDEDEDRR
jgi:pSer/pThr/pTyr-binding forkhead associated (FHA) protein